MHRVKGLRFLHEDDGETVFNATGLPEFKPGDVLFFEGDRYRVISVLWSSGQHISVRSEAMNVEQMLEVDCD